MRLPLITICLVWLLPLASVSRDLVVSIDVTQPAGEPYEDAIAILKSAGVGTTSLSLFWDDLEPEQETYAPEFDWPAIANAYYPTQAMSLTLTFSVIDTVTDRRRANLKGLDWDDPVVLTAFSRHLQEVMSRMPDVELLTISIGNEVDGFLATDADILAFSRFLAAARNTLEGIRPRVTVGTKLTYGALVADPDRWKPLLFASSAAHVTYYPLTKGFAVRAGLVVAEDIGTMTRIAGALPVYILEAGYPSEGCGAQDQGQLAFTRDLIAAATAMQDQVRLVSLTWLTDIPAAQVSEYGRYYGVQDPCFDAYLSSLGLRTSDGRPKPALRWLAEQN